jgi:hypothetical protein
MLKGSDDKYEFKKTCRFDTKDSKVEGYWDAFGRYFTIVGQPKMKSDTIPKQIRFFNVLGEMIKKVEGVRGIQQFAWRPRPSGVLTAKQEAVLKSDFKTKYNKIFREEEKQEK